MNSSPADADEYVLTEEEEVELEDRIAEINVASGSTAMKYSVSCVTVAVLRETATLAGWKPA